MMNIRSRNESPRRLSGSMKVAGLVALGWVIFHFTSVTLFFSAGNGAGAGAGDANNVHTERARSVQKPLRMPDVTIVAKLTYLRHIYITGPNFKQYQGNFLFVVQIESIDPSSFMSEVRQGFSGWKAHIQLVVYCPRDVEVRLRRETVLPLSEALPYLSIVFVSPIPKLVPVYARDSHITGAELWWYSDPALPSRVTTSYVLFAPLNLLPSEAFLRSFWTLKRKILDPSMSSTIWAIAGYSSPFLDVPDAPTSVTDLEMTIHTPVLQQVARIGALELPRATFNYTSFLRLGIDSPVEEISYLPTRYGLHPFYMLHVSLWPRLYETSVFDTSDAGYDGTNARLPTGIKVATLPLGFLFSDLASPFTLAVHCSVDKYKVIGQMASRWRGPISVAFYVHDASDVWEIESLAVEYPNLKYRLLHEDMSTYKSKYPVNILRNLALDAVETQFNFLIDADFVVNEGIEGYLQSNYPRLLRQQSSLALVIPCFTTNADPPYTFKELKAQVENSVAFPCGADPWKDIQNPHAHMWGTNYTRWYNATAPYRVPKYYRAFEPYVVVSTMCAPRYHPSFIWYGDDKVVFQEHLHRLNFTWEVQPEQFVVHIPHPKATWAGKERDRHYEAIKDAWAAWEEEIGETPQALCDEYGTPRPEYTGQVISLQTRQQYLHNVQMVASQWNARGPGSTPSALTISQVLGIMAAVGFGAVVLVCVLMTLGRRHVNLDYRDRHPFL